MNALNTYLSGMMSSGMYPQRCATTLQVSHATNQILSGRARKERMSLIQ